LGPPFRMMYAAWTRETMVVTIQVEKMIMSRRRRPLSRRPLRTRRGAMSRMESAIVSAVTGIQLSKQGMSEMDDEGGRTDELADGHLLAEVALRVSFVFPSVSAGFGLAYPEELADQQGGNEPEEGCDAEHAFSAYWVHVDADDGEE